MFACDVCVCVCVCVFACDVCVCVCVCLHVMCVCVCVCVCVLPSALLMHGYCGGSHYDAHGGVKPKMRMGASPAIDRPTSQPKPLVSNGPAGLQSTSGADPPPAHTCANGASGRPLVFVCLVHVTTQGR